ncbi:MAG TPA: hypothetical protein DEP84_19990, partial [Chloroflexi bacterium]|nr:hypothetical protein [Chloroflexota bacterium]
MEFRYQTEDGQLATVQVERAGDGYRIAVSIGEEPARHYTVGVRQLTAGTVLLTVDGRRVQAYVAEAEGHRFVA